MPATQFEYDNFVAANQATGNATETVIATTKPVSSAYTGASFAIHFSGLFTAGTSTTSVTFKIREGSLTGTTIATYAAVAITAGQSVLISFDAIDGNFTDVAGQTWVLTAQQAAGAGAGGFVNGFSTVTSPV